MLIEKLAATDAAVIMKIGRNFPKIREALRVCGLDERALYVERGTMDGEKVMALKDKTDDFAPYFAIVLVGGQGRRP
jgi:precorrin-2/cobalt-factor-2 C20-methyltransferase